MTEPIYFERDRYDLPIPLFELNPHPASGEITFIQTQDLSEQQRSIFQVLQQILSPLGVRFEFSLQHQPQMAEFTSDAEQTTFQSADGYWQALEYRLWIRCYAQTALDSQLIAEPLAKQLRRLNFQHFQDAIVQFSRFSSRSAMGNQIPDWRLRIDLTPPTVRLRSWARWGDVQAITKLLNLALAPEEIQVSTVLRNLTLQIFCTLKNPQSAKFPTKKNCPRYDRPITNFTHASRYSRSDHSWYSISTQSSRNRRTTRVGSLARFTCFGRSELFTDTDCYCRTR